MPAEMRDYDVWHAGYDDPCSTLSWRLSQVQAAIGAALDKTRGSLRLISACAGDGRDVVGTLMQRDDANRVRATLLELHPAVADRARQAAARAGLTAQVEVRRVDAGDSDAYLDLAPADVVLLAGIFGNISEEELEHTIAASPQLCAPGATLVWTRARGGELNDRNASVRSWLSAAGFAELDYLTIERGSKPAVGVVRYDGPPVDLVPARHWFTFQR